MRSPPETPWAIAERHDTTRFIHELLGARKRLSCGPSSMTFQSGRSIAPLANTTLQEQFTSEAPGHLMRPRNGTATLQSAACGPPVVYGATGGDPD